MNRSLRNYSLFLSTLLCMPVPLMLNASQGDTQEQEDIAQYAKTMIDNDYKWNSQYAFTPESLQKGIDDAKKEFQFFDSLLKNKNIKERARLFSDHENDQILYSEDDVSDDIIISILKYKQEKAAKAQALINELKTRESKYRELVQKEGREEALKKAKLANEPHYITMHFIPNVDITAYEKSFVSANSFKLIIAGLLIYGAWKLKKYWYPTQPQEGLAAEEKIEAPEMEPIIEL